jgi:GT2 family glycosyltransferase
MNDFVAIITINYNHSGMTIECINSVLKSAYENYLIYLVDNGSESEDYLNLFEFAKQHNKIRLLRIDRNRGYVGGINYALEEADKSRVDHFLIMNNDTIIDYNAIKHLVRTAKKHNDNAVVSGIVYDHNRPNTVQTTGSKFSNKKYLKERYPYRGQSVDPMTMIEEERDLLDDIFWLLPTKIVEKTGKYSEDFFLYAEQADYALRAVNQGFKLIFTPRAKIWHKGSITTGQGNRHSPPVSFWRNKSSTIYLFKHLKPHYFLLITFKRLTKLLFVNIKNFVTRKPRLQKKSDRAAIDGLFYGLAWTVNQKPDNGYNPYL